jgi:hypothetical protein|uniref:Uncharacterized protein n=1 Tax=viral metagenome TaxID=1070528 RepID=A0A6C0ALB5_9ZZZZ
MIKLNKFYPNKPFFKMTIGELKEFVELQKYKGDKKRKKRKTRRKYNTNNKTRKNIN